MALRINPPQPPRPVLGPPRPTPAPRLPSWTAGYQTQTPAAPQPPQPTAQPAAQEWPSPHPPNAYYISDDGLVSYDEQGYRLDSNGNRAFGGGGGGGGGSSSPTLPAYYQTPFEQLFGTLGSYYTPTRGGPEQAYTDYQTLGNMWAQETGLPLAPEQWAGLFANYGNYARNYAQPLAVPNFMGWVRSNMLTRPAAPPPIAYLKVGEL